MTLQIKAIGKTDKGLVRSGNEDCLHIDENNHVYAVCDGMGGHQAGEVASMTACETLFKAFTHFSADLLGDTRIGTAQTLPPSGDLLIKSIRLANRSISNFAHADPALSGMGTTIVAVALEADIMSIAHVGDSRAYRLDERKLTPLTKDHSWIAELQETQKMTAEEASSVVGKNVITRALGVRDNVEIDIRVEKVKPGGIFILCSDGLCGFADDDEIYDVAAKSRNDLNGMAASLVQMANDRGGSDNVTIIAFQVVEVNPSALPPLDVFTVGVEDPEVSEVEDDWLRKFQSREVETVPGTVAKPGINPALLVAIFVIFAIVAALLIWTAD